jgi:hypothetical protein
MSATTLSQALGQVVVGPDQAPKSHLGHGDGEDREGIERDDIKSGVQETWASGSRS